MTIIAVSDVHLGLKEANESKFKEFLESLNFKYIEDFVLLGDIVDMWRRDFTKAMLENTQSLLLLTQSIKKTKVHYIAGNHDYYFLRLKELFGERYPFEVHKSTVLRSNSADFYFIHGYQLEVLCNPYNKSMSTYETFSEHLCLAGDDTGNAAEALWKLYTASKSWISNLVKVPENIELTLKSMFDPPEKRLTGKHAVIDPIETLANASDVRHFLIGIRPEEFLIYGHTHRPYIDTTNRVANTGCWGVGDEGTDGKNFSYLEIEDGIPKLNTFK